MIDSLRIWWERKFFRVAIYMVFAFFSFILFFFWTFPNHRIKEIATNEIEAAFDHEYDVTIADMSFWRVTGIQMEGIRLRERIDTEEEDGPMPMTINLESISARFSPLRSILNRGPAVTFQIDVGGSVIPGRFEQTGFDPNTAEQRLFLTMKEVDLRQSTLLASLVGLPVFGILDGEVELHLDGARGMVTSGDVKLSGRQLTLGATQIQSEQIPVFTSLDLPTTSFGNLDLHLNIEETERGSQIVFEEFHTEGRDIKTEVWGHIEMLPSGGRPRLELRLQVNEDYVTEHELGMLFSMKEFRDGEYRDWYGFVLAGSFGDIKFNGSQTAAQGQQASAGDDDEAEDEDDGDGGAEE